MATHLEVNSAVWMKMLRKLSPGLTWFTLEDGSFVIPEESWQNKILIESKLVV